MSTDLHAVVEEAYAVFSRYRPTGALTVCNCDVCMSLEAERALTRTPLREIPSALLAEYTNSAHGYDEGAIATELRYFLPRYFELIAAGDPPDLGLDICLRRLGEASYRTNWPAEEASVIDRFFDAFVIASAARVEVVEWPIGWLPVFDMTDALTMALTAGGDVERLIRALESAPDPGAAVHFASLRRRLRQVGGGVHLFESAYFEEEQFHDAAERLGTWLVGPPIRARIEAAFFLVEDSRLQEFLSQAAW
jgi:hypothetical protein